jgi:hypothetical protein
MRVPFDGPFRHVAFPYVRMCLIHADQKIKLHFCYNLFVARNSSKCGCLLSLLEIVGVFICTQSVAFWCMSVIQGILPN